MSLPAEIRRILTRNGKYRRVFGTDDGQWVLNDLMKLAGIGRPDITMDAGEALARENRKFIPLHIATVLNLSDTEIVRRAQQSNVSGDDDE